MLMTQSMAEVKTMLLRQLGSFFFLSDKEEREIDLNIAHAMKRCERSFSKTKNKYYNEAGVTKFDPLHGCQWSRFLYELARCIFSGGGGIVCV